MNKHIRGLYLAFISVITLLSTFLFIETYRTFDFLFNNIWLNIRESVVIYGIFIFLISITGYVSFFYNRGLLKESKTFEETKLLDGSEVKPIKTVGWKYYVHMLFCILIVGFGIFMLIKPLQETYAFEKLPNGIEVYFVVLLIIGLGVVLIRDAIQIKRYITNEK